MIGAVLQGDRRGAKHICADCQGKFYDLGKRAAVCPKCGGKPVEDKLPRSNRVPRKSSSGASGRYP